MSRETNYRVWWIPQVSKNQYDAYEPFYVFVSSPLEAKKLLIVLVEYDKFQFENKIKGDYCNMGGLEYYEDCDWTEWYSNGGFSIDEIDLKALKAIKNTVESV